jgi:peptide deformylase
VPASDPVLHRESLKVPVENITGRDTRQVAAALFGAIDVLREQHGLRTSGIHAKQLGYDVAVYVAITAPYDYDSEVALFINSELDEGQQFQPSVESCLSCPGVSGTTDRPTEVRVHHYDAKARRREVVAVGLGAACHSHETDHEKGLLFGGRTLRQGRPLRFMPPELVLAHRECARGSQLDAWPLAFPVDQWQAYMSGAFDLSQFELGS